MRVSKAQRCCFRMMWMQAMKRLVYVCHICIAIWILLCRIHVKHVCVFLSKINVITKGMFRHFGLSHLTLGAWLKILSSILKNWVPLGWNDFPISLQDHSFVLKIKALLFHVISTHSKRFPIYIGISKHWVCWAHCSLQSKCWR